MTLITILALGFFLGIRHATDADHVVAVTTIVSRERSTRSAMWVGALWGIGHTATILVVGGAIVVFGIVIPPRVGLSMELSVAGMLVVLGVMNVVRARQQLREAAGHTAHQHKHDPPQSRGGRLRPLVVGVVHGLAGSAAVALLVLTTLRDAVTAILYLAVFGAGTVLGMMLLTTAIGVPAAAASRRFASFERRLATVTGLVSIAFGVFLAYQIGFVDGLFLGTAVWTPK